LRLSIQYQNKNMSITKVFIVVPVFNEEKYVGRFIKDLFNEVLNNKQITKVVFVNDGSTDKTENIILKQKLKYSKIVNITLPKNFGKGVAMKQGIKFAKKNNANAVIFMDGDRQHSPKHLNSFLNEIENVPVVFGYRQLLSDAPKLRKAGNLFAGVIIRYLFNIKRKDILCGFIALRKDVFYKINWRSKGYGVEAEMSAIVGRKKIDFSELLVSTIYFDVKKGVTMKHAIKIFLHLPIWYLKS